jgi:histone deacetylase HOS3
MVESAPPLGLFIQPACLQHKYIRHANSSHIFERPERLRAVLLGVAAAVARLEEAETALKDSLGNGNNITQSAADDLSSMLSGLSIQQSFASPNHLSIVTPPLAKNPGQILLHHPALQLAHSPPSPSLLDGGAVPASTYLRNLHRWASEAVDTIKHTGCEIPPGLGLNQGDLYLGPGSILAIEGAVCLDLFMVTITAVLIAVGPDSVPGNRPGLHIPARRSIQGCTLHTAQRKARPDHIRSQTRREAL